MKVFLGASGAVNPLGNTLPEIFSEMQTGKTGIKRSENAFGLGSDEYLGVIDEKLLPQNGEDKIYRMLESTLLQTVVQLSKPETLRSKSTRLIVCSTKGNIDQLEQGNSEGTHLHLLGKYIKQKFDFSTEPLVISAACISGLLGIINGARMIQQGLADHVVVAGVDLVTKFTLSGFVSFYATASGVSQPYDDKRDGINLGEASASVVLSNDKSIFNTANATYLGGATANDANHISGPSRTGEGLYRSIIHAINDASSDANSIDYISAHGTATSFNDEMESIAFSRAGLSTVPLNSFKGYFGHTLGAAGLIETLIGIESLRQNILLKSYGFDTPGTSENINVLSQNLDGNYKRMLKTASGFGGSNAAAIFQKA